MKMQTQNTVEFHEDKSDKQTLWNIDPRKIEVKPGYNPRTIFDPVKIEELKNSIIEKGVETPLFIYPNNDKPGFYWLKRGERRLRATMKAIAEGHNIARVPCFRSFLKDGAAAILEEMRSNQGEQLTPLEEGMAYQRCRRFGHTVKEIASEMGKPVSYIESCLALEAAPESVKKAVSEQKISVTNVAKISKKEADPEKVTETVATVIKSAEERGKKKATTKDIESLNPSDAAYKKIKKANEVLKTYSVTVLSEKDTDILFNFLNLVAQEFEPKK